jgi:hypothetical protein
VEPADDGVFHHSEDPQDCSDGRIFTAFQAQADAKELITWDINVDSTVCRAHHAVGRGKGEVRKDPPGGVSVGEAWEMRWRDARAVPSWRPAWPLLTGQHPQRRFETRVLASHCQWVCDRASGSPRSDPRSRPDPLSRSSALGRIGVECWDEGPRSRSWSPGRTHGWAPLLPMVPLTIRHASGTPPRPRRQHRGGARADVFGESGPTFVFSVKGCTRHSPESRPGVELAPKPRSVGRKTAAFGSDVSK